MKLSRICVFCGSSEGRDPEYVNQAKLLGQILAERKKSIVYGGARIGLMGALADSALAAGAEVIGVIPGALADKEIAHDGLSSLYIVDSMHERKAMMAELADAFLVLPGGIGTMEEFFEIWTWNQLGLISKPIGILNTVGYFDSLLHFFERMSNASFLSARYHEMLHISTDTASLISLLEEAVPVAVEKWIDRRNS